jgi:lysylphosphatidylglycerol synthetase-like protein (DUF2156 family)
MNNTGRLVLGVIAGVTIWSLLWIAGTGAAQAAFPDVLDPAQRLEHVGALLGYIAYSVVLSLLSGYVAAAAAAAGGARAAMRAAWIVAVILLGLGIFFEVLYWEMLPVWYHLVFLALLVPATVYGGKLKAG